MRKRACACSDGAFIVTVMTRCLLAPRFAHSHAALAWRYVHVRVCNGCVYVWLYRHNVMWRRDRRYVIRSVSTVGQVCTFCPQTLYRTRTVILIRLASPSALCASPSALRPPPPPAPETRWRAAARPRNFGLKHPAQGGASL